MPEWMNEQMNVGTQDGRANWLEEMDERPKVDGWSVCYWVNRSITSDPKSRDRPEKLWERAEREPVETTDSVVQRDHREIAEKALER